LKGIAGTEIPEAFVVIVSAALRSGLVVPVVHPVVVELGFRHHPVPGMSAAHVCEIALIIRGADNGANE
jgi:hypothetical protein